MAGIGGLSFRGNLSPYSFSPGSNDPSQSRIREKERCSENGLRVERGRWTRRRVQANVACKHLCSAGRRQNTCSHATFFPATDVHRFDGLWVPSLSRERPAPSLRSVFQRLLKGKIAARRPPQHRALLAIKTPPTVPLRPIGGAEAGSVFLLQGQRKEIRGDRVVAGGRILAGYLHADLVRARG